MPTEIVGATPDDSPLRLPFGRNPGPGKLISIDGLDGAGKSTLARGLADLLTGVGLSVVRTRFPTDHMRRLDFFDLVQRQGRVDVVDPTAFEVEYMVDRIQHSKIFIEPALRAGSWVIADRYALSSIGTLLLRLPTLCRTAISAISSEAWFKDLCRYLVRPDLALMLRVDPATAVTRLNTREGEIDRGIDAGQYADLQRFVLDVARANEMRVVDTTGPFDAVLDACATLVDGLRSSGGLEA